MLFLLWRQRFHVRIVITFIVVLFVSLLIAYVYAYFMYPEHYQSELSVTSIESGMNTVLQAKELDSFEDIEELAQSFHAEVIAVNANRDVAFATEQASSISATSTDRMDRLDELETAFTFRSDVDMFEVVVPQEVQGEDYAFVYQFDITEESEAVRHVVLVVLMIVLIIGSLGFLVASTPIISPINQLSNAARKMAKGDFSVYIKKKREDEIGELVDNFNYMSKELQQIETMRQEFVSNVSHEFKSPMTTINGFVQAIRDGVVKEDEQKEYLDIIHSSTQRLSRLSDHLLQLASLESEHHPIEKHEYLVDEQIRRVVLSTQLLWEQKNITINIDLPQIMIVADQDLMEQVWMNLLTNAIKFSDRGGVIDIEAKHERGKFTIIFRDQGIGIPKEHLPYVFERFYTVDTSRTPQISGNGLGLSLVKRILDLHKFTIKVESKRNVGTSMYVTINEADNER
ncbi:hypothetical protein DH09_03860 [Bacillaceae bacterium JMAK1]|nr:hypothetical protein DH09_03860 [Bacillaceae bacterium JMAK1]